MFNSDTPYYLRKTHKIYLNPDGVVCNRLKTGTKVLFINTKGSWIQITWRKGKKRMGNTRFIVIYKVTHKETKAVEALAFLFFAIFSLFLRPNIIQGRTMIKPLDLMLIKAMFNANFISTTILMFYVNS